jgi:hypothetical protein
VKTPRIRALERAVAKYQTSLENFAAIREELRRLPPSDRLSEILHLTEETLRSTEQLARNAAERLARERARGAMSTVVSDLPADLVAESS